MTENNDSVNIFLQDKWRPEGKMSVSQLREEVRQWRELWRWLHEDTKYYLQRIGQMCRVVMRNYQGHLGIMLSPIFDLKFIELGTEEKSYDQKDGKYYIETKTMRIPAGMILDIEFISERTPAEESTQVGYVPTPETNQSQKSPFESLLED